MGPPELIAIARANAAARIKEIDIQIFGPSGKSLKEAKELMAECASRGANPKEITGNLAGTLEPFEWPEFDKWVKIFREAGEWPALWEDIAEYYNAIDHESAEGLLYWLKKDGLLRLAEIKGLTLKKTLKKETMLAEIAAVVSKNDKPTVLQLIWPDGDKSLHRAKSALLAHTVSMGCDMKELHEKYVNPNDRIEIDPAPDCCSWCEKKSGKKYRVATIKQENLPPFHPGCRCGILPV